MPVEHHDSSAVNLGTTQSPAVRASGSKRWRTLGSVALIAFIAAAAVPGILKLNGRNPPSGPAMASPEIPSSKLPVAAAAPAAVSVGLQTPPSELGNSGAPSAQLSIADSDANREAIVTTVSAQPTRGASRPSTASRAAAAGKSPDFRAFPAPHANKVAVPKAERTFIEPWASQ